MTAFLIFLAVLMPVFGGLAGRLVKLNRLVRWYDDQLATVAREADADLQVQLEKVHDLAHDVVRLEQDRDRWAKKASYLGGYLSQIRDHNRQLFNDALRGSVLTVEVPGHWMYTLNPILVDHVRINALARPVASGSSIMGRELVFTIKIVVDPWELETGFWRQDLAARHAADEIRAAVMKVKPGDFR
jgi:hypothetical protein